MDKKNKPLKIQNEVVFGSWDEVDNLSLETITHRPQDSKKMLSGLIIKGYETKFANGTNSNYEVFDRNCLDKFINEYFVNNNLNMVVDLEHGIRFDDKVGRVLAIEVNTIGFYFVVYIPKKNKRYEEIKIAIEEGILQGFSKLGWATDYDNIYNSDGYFDHIYVKEMAILSVSLVSNPANGVSFEKVQEVKDSLIFSNKNKKETDEWTKIFK